MRRILITLLLTIYFPIITMAQFSPEPINGQCGDFAGTTFDVFPTQYDQASKLCAQGEFDQRLWTNIDNNNPNQIQNFSRLCKGINGGETVACNAKGDTHYYENNIAKSCGTAKTASFMTTASPIGIAYTNFQNKFLGNLCNQEINGQTIAVGPVEFNQTAIGRTRQCPTLSGKIECGAKLYQHANCGLAANTGHQYTPTQQLCAPGYIASSITFDTDTHLRNWECIGEGGANPAYCHARSTQNDSDFQPSCNPLVSTKKDPDTNLTLIQQFPAQACSVGEVSYRSVNQTLDNKYYATWKCKTPNNETPNCPKVIFSNFAKQQGANCNVLTNNTTVDSVSELFAKGLCEAGGTPNYFQELDNQRSRTCGAESCSATKSFELQYCGWAQHAPSQTYPTQGLCTQGEVTIMQDIQSVTGYYRKRSCTTPQGTAYCQSPRIIDGMCQRATTVNKQGFTTPQEILDAGMCAEGIPEPLVPVQNTDVNKRTRKCVSPTAGGNNSQSCSANVAMPKLSIQYDPAKPTDGSTVTGPVTVSLTGFNPIYLDFVYPLHQRYRIQNKNTGFTFVVQDRAGNKQEIQTFVDWIDTSLPSAQPIYSPNTPTTGNVVVTLTGFTSDSIHTTRFTGPCIDQGTCNAFISQYNNTATKITFTDNGEGTLILIDDLGENTIPLVVTGIDRTPPTAHIEYDIISPTNQNVTANIVNPSEDITSYILLSGSDTNTGLQTDHYTFTGNNEVVFKIQDGAENVNYLTASVDWIDKTLPTGEIFYSTTGITANNVIATIGNFSKTGTTVLNNSGSNSFTFTYNHSFTFRIQDPVGNINEITATVNWIDKPILPQLIQQYENNICHKFKKRLPIDIQGNEFAFHIITAVRNCLMKGYTLSNNHTYFYPRKPITRGEFITILGRYIRLISNYNNTSIQDLSPYFVGVDVTGSFGPEISEADALGLLFYTPIAQSGIQKTINVQGEVSSKEAKAMITHAMKLLGLNTKPVEYLFVDSGIVTRGDVAYIFANLIQNYEQVAVGNNLEFLKALNIATQGFTPLERRKFITKILYKIHNIADATMERVGLDPDQLKADLVAIAQGSLPIKTKKVFIRIKTIMDNRLRNYDDPFNNETFNDSQIYTKAYTNTDIQYEYNKNIYTQ